MTARHLGSGAIAWARTLRAVMLLATAALVSGCGGFDYFTSAQAAKATAPASVPTAPELVEIAVGPPNAQLAPGTRTQFTATGLYEDGSRRDLTRQVSWSCADQTVAAISVDQSGAVLFTAMNPGETRVTATLGKLSQSVPLTVTRATLVSISVTPSASVLAKGTQQKFVATAVYSDNTVQDLTLSAQWSTGNPSIASVTRLEVAGADISALDTGTTNVTASFEGIAASAVLNVTPATLRSIEVSPATREIAMGLSTNYKATGIYTDGSVQDITGQVVWASTTASVASISNGIATGTSPGTTRISAALAGVTGSATLRVTAAQLTSIAISPATSSIANGLSVQLTAIGTYTDNSTQDLTGTVVWSSSDSAIASISNAAGFQGQVRAAQPGSATITATAGAVSATTAITVTAATLVSISVTPTALTLAKGTQAQLVATGTYTDNSTQDLTTAVTWTSSDVAVTISNAGGSQGLATGADVGQSTVSAALGSVSGSTTLTVTGATLVSISVVPSAPSIAKGTQKQFSATGTYSDGSTQDLTSAVTWASSDTAIATISNTGGLNGLTSSLAVGSSTISAALDGVTGSTVLTVTPATLVSIAVTPASLSIAKGTQRQFTATGTYTDSSTQDLTSSVTWGSSTPATATLSNAGGSKGLATAANVGMTNVSATLGSISGSTGLTVTQATLVSIAVTPTTATIAIGTQKQFTATGTYTDGSTQNLAATVTWSSSNTSAATISNAGGSNGLATAAAAGSTSISATSGSVTAPAATLTVNNGQAYVYAVNQSAGNVSQYKVEADGTLSSNGTAATGNTPTAITIDPQRRYAYVTNQSDNSVSRYTVGTDGTLTPSGTTATGITPTSATVDPTGQYFYVANFDDSTISQYTIGASGDLGSLGAAMTTGFGPNLIAADPLGRAVYTANMLDDSISQFQISATGALTSLGTVPAESGPTAIAIDPGGRYAYAANFQIGTISQYSIGTGGALTPMGSVATGAGPFSIAVDPTGRFVYTADYYDNTVSAFSIGSGGTLTSLGAIASDAGPYSISVDPSGRYAYVANSSANTVSQYTIDVSGALSGNGSASSGAYPVAVFSSY